MLKTKIHKAVVLPSRDGQCTNDVEINRTSGNNIKPILNLL